MTTKDLFRLIIKVFGLYSLILSIFQAVPSAIGYYSFQGFDAWYIFFFIGIIVIIIGVYYFLLKNVDLIINWLKLDKGFDDERIAFGNLDARKIVSLATVLVGGFLVVDYLPSFLYNCYFAFKNSVDSGNGFDSVMSSLDPKISYFNWAISIMNLGLGYLFLTNHEFIASRLVNQTDENIR